MYRACMRLPCDPCRRQALGLLALASAAYASDLKLDGKVKLPIGVAAVDTKLELPLAHAFRADAIWQATDKLALSFGGAFENWSELNETDLDFGPGETTIKLGFNRTSLDVKRVVRRLDAAWVHGSIGSPSAHAPLWQRGARIRDRLRNDSPALPM